MVHNDRHTDSNFMGLGRSRIVVFPPLSTDRIQTLVEYAALTRALMTLVPVGSGARRAENTNNNISTVVSEKWRLLPYV